MPVQVSGWLGGGAEVTEVVMKVVGLRRSKRRLAFCRTPSRTPAAHEPFKPRVEDAGEVGKSYQTNIHSTAYFVLGFLVI